MGRTGDATRSARTSLLPTLLPTFLMAVLVVMRHPWTVVTSDTTAQQSLLRTWLDVGHLDAYLPPDTWILKLPVYLLVEPLPIDPGTKLLIDALALNLITFALLGWAVWVLARVVRARWYELTVPLLWLAGLGGGVGSNRMLLNYRNVELGLSFAALALAAHHLRADRPRARVRAYAVAAVLLSVFWLDDPYFALLVGVPFIGAALLWFAFRDRDRKLLALSAALAASLLILPLWHRLLARLGYHVGSTGEGVSLDPIVWWHDLDQVGSGVAVQLGFDHGDGVLFLLTRVALVSALAVTLLASAGLARHGWRNRRFVLCFVGLHWPVVVAGYLASSTADEHGSSRYLILAVYDLAVSAALALPLLRRRGRRLGRLLAGACVALLLGSTALNVASAARSVGGPAPALTRARDQQLAAVLSTGLTKGYGQFWSGNVLIYLSGGRVDVNAVRCHDGRFVYDTWLTDTARYQRVPATSTFLVWEPGVPYFSNCTRAEVDRLLGPPQRSIPAGAGSTVLVYGRDIGPLLFSSPARG